MCKDLRERLVNRTGMLHQIAETEQDYQHADRSELATQIRARPFPDRASNELHSLRADISLTHLLDQHPGVGQAAKGDNDVDDEQGHLRPGGEHCGEFRQ